MKGPDILDKHLTSVSRPFLGGGKVRNRLRQGQVAQPLWKNMQIYLPKENDTRYRLLEDMTVWAGQLQANTLTRVWHHEGWNKNDWSTYQTKGYAITIPAGSVFTWRTVHSRDEGKLVIELRQVPTEMEYLLHTKAGKKTTANIDFPFQHGMQILAEAAPESQT